jgi:hypothetical protein
MYGTEGSILKKKKKKTWNYVPPNGNVCTEIITLWL